MPIYWESLSSSLADEALGKTAIGFIRVTLYVCESGVNRKYRNKYRNTVSKEGCGTKR